MINRVEDQGKPKPFHLLTPAEKTALRIAQNRAIEEKIKETKTEPKAKKPPASSTADFVRATPEERATSMPRLIRKVQS
jgi:hypothetical protein